MSTTSANPSRTDTVAARRLRTTMAAVRLSFTWFGVRRSLSAEQKEQAADSFGAEGAYLSAAKKLIDTSHSAYKAVTAIRGRAQQFWRSLSVPYPEPGIRLIRQDNIATFDVQLTTMQAELAEAVESLNEHFDELKSAARERLGRLFNRADYPESLIGLFRIEHDYPSVEPPSYLRELEHDASLVTLDLSAEARFRNGPFLFGCNLHMRAFMRDDGDRGGLIIRSGFVDDEGGEHCGIEDKVRSNMPAAHNCW
jgi:hypothetical protein